MDLMRVHTIIAALAALTALSAPVSAKVLKLEATVTSATGASFSAPIFTFNNLSDPGNRVTNVSVNGGAPWDWIIIGAAGTPYEILNPAGGTRTLITGQESVGNPDDGCTASLAYGLTSFDAGESFRFSADPESPGCGSAVVDVRAFLTSGTLGVGVTFDDGTMLSGSAWVEETPDLPVGYMDELYRLSLSVEIADPVPEPASWAMMIAGFGLAGAAMRRRGAPALA
jgi:hypothetical protein